MPEKQEIFTLMGGRVNMWRGHYNPTSDAVWLASAAGNAKTMLDVGIGTGGVALCWASRFPDAAITGIDLSPQMLAECEKNAKLNNREIELINTDIYKWRTARTFDLVLTNPPYFNGTPARHAAHHNADLDKWFTKCAARVRPRGILCTIVDSGVSARVISAISDRFGDINIYPLFGAGAVAERVIIRARLGVHSPTVIHRAISMNNSDVLRHGLTIDDALARL